MASRPPGSASNPAGVYLAHHRWLDQEYGPGQLFKVGHTGDLGARLTDSGYITCFPPGWRYVATYELSSKEDAHLLETAVLHCCRHYRLGTRELVHLPAERIIAITEDAARALGLEPTAKRDPVYLGGRARSTGPRGGAPDAIEPPSAWAAKRALVDALTLDPEAPTPATEAVDEISEALEALALSQAPRPACAPDAALGALIDDILEWDFSVVVTKQAESKALEAARQLPTLVEKEPEPPATQDQLMGDVDDTALAGEMDLVEAEMTAAEAQHTASPFDVTARPLEVREYQRDATGLCIAELRARGAAILQMACRCGKTPVAYGVIQDFCRDAKPILFLVPGLSLLRQTAQKLAQYGLAVPMLLVGSDPRPVPVARAGAPAELTMTTEPAVIRAFLSEAGTRIVLSTYQSSPQVPTDAFALTVFDESHRVCGGKAPRPFNHTVLAPRVGARLFMTATPAYDGALSMKDRTVFGGVAYRYHLRQGIAAGYVNDFRLEIVAAPSDRSTPAAEEAAIPEQLLAAMGKVDKLLVFCRDIRHATRLCAALKTAVRPDAVAAFECLVAHSRMGAGGAAASLRRFAAPGTRAVLFNCRLFQEGVEIPPLNAVFFAAPRHSPRDIIQSVCRPLNRVEGKPSSVIFLPVLHDPKRKPDDPANLKRYASIVPFVDALLDEDPRLYEHLLDPRASPYPVDILGTHSLGLPADPKENAASRAALLGAVRRAVRYNGSTSARPSERLLRVENVPWDRAFAEVRRVVETCGRYPKTTDAWVVGEARVCLHRFYRWAADAYRAKRDGKASPLEPHQVHDLASLPGWEPYGIEGPYPWKACIAFLETWLEEHEGVPPMIEINKGGYVGLEATMVERLSGALTCINQGDGRARKGKAPGSGFTIDPAKQADLDRICKRFNLRWRKERTLEGGLVKEGPQSFIQEAYSRFKAYYKAHGAGGEYIQKWFPGYPRKHARQERLDVQEAGVAPPRWKTGRRRYRRDEDDDEGDSMDADSQ